MPFINLIHEQRIAAAREDRKSKLLFLTFVGVMLTSVGGFSAMTFASQQVHVEEAALQAQIERAKPLIAQTEANQLLQAKLTPRLTTLQNAQEDTQRWDHLLAYLSTQTPPQAWLTGVRCTSGDPKKGVTVTFQGLAMSQQPVAEMILRLQNSVDLSDVNLKYTQEKMIAQQKTTEYQIEAVLQGTAPKKKTIEETK